MSFITVRSDGLVSHPSMRTLRDAVLRCERHASKHHGIISRAEAFQFGMTKRTIDSRVSDGAWIRVLPGVYRVAAFPETWRGRLQAALLWAGPDAFVSHRSAAALYGLDGFREGPIEITAHGSKTAQGIKVHRMGRRARIRVIDGIRVSWAERTLLDVCASSPPVTCGLALDDALRKRLVTLERLWDELKACRSGVRGSGTFRTLLMGRDERDGNLESKLEAKLMVILKRIKETTFEVQHSIGCGDKRYRLDFFHQESRLGVEGHSFTWHFGELKHDEDSKRHNDLTLSGIRMLYFTWDQVVFKPKEVEAQVRTALGLTPATGEAAA